MPIPFVVSEKKIPTKNGMKTVYCPRLVKTTKISLRDISRDLSDATTLTKADIYAVMIGMTEQIAAHILAGRVVEIEDFGSFRLSAKTSAAENASDVNAKLISNPRVNFRPALDFKRKLLAAKFVRK